MSKCDHVLGKGFILNPEEGSAYLLPYIRTSTMMDFQDDDWTIVYPYCPACGHCNVDMNLSKELRIKKEI